MTHRTQEALLARRGRNPSAVELYEAQWPSGNQGTVPDNLKTDPNTLPDKLKQALDDTAPLLGPAVAEVLDDTAPPDMSIEDPTVAPPPPPSQAANTFNFISIPKARWPMATLIVDAFAQAGYGKLQQAAALANAINESGLNPSIKSPDPEDSWGLFQLNRRGGLGAGKSPAFLKDPNNNIQIILDKVSQFPAFKAANTVAQAVSVFVRKVENPKHPEAQVAVRLQTANKLLA